MRARIRRVEKGVAWKREVNVCDLNEARNDRLFLCIRINLRSANSLYLRLAQDWLWVIQAAVLVHVACRVLSLHQVRKVEARPIQR
ncbi:uncharacterized protein PHACADRAFT_160888 [Phanerochaete carnosa HHB-10118-sp]|uniref:Uncharacterized protein n=1 Tax=Phanerochaete carnosa (strain HHB-10118-sp) TaxID=650164 RepID=K5W7J4_PHACS|nr:uncharacterized protein PHACADRAFT_160888 [Phanerochaete carnosa HHB-10118-sp]EKM54934.1 hypothetical protein PHACADRAFT_160888 [Phanerochaete carnosa HHB-10118-sp]